MFRTAPNGPNSEAVLFFFHLCLSQEAIANNNKCWDSFQNENAVLSHNIFCCVPSVCTTKDEWSVR